MWRLTAASKNLSRNSIQGMTLVEVLLAVTLFSTMMGATGALLQSGFRAQMTWGRAVEPAVRMERALNRLNLDISAAQKLFASAAHGTKEQFAFARVESLAIEDAPATEEWVRVVYKIDDENGELVLVREAAVWRLSQDDPNPQTREVLLPVIEAAWAFARADAQGQLIWTDAWDGSADGVPQLVRLTCTLPASAGNALTITRVFRNPAGNLPVEEQQP